MGAHISVPMFQRTVPLRYALLGLRCNHCGKACFPAKSVCPHCLVGDSFAPVRLSGKGTVYGYTGISGAGAPPEFGPEAVARGSYPVVMVELDEGPRIVGQLAGGHAAVPGIGHRVAAEFRRLYVEEGVIRYGFKFRPLETEG